MFRWGPRGEKDGGRGHFASMERGVTRRQRGDMARGWEGERRREKMGGVQQMRVGGLAQRRSRRRELEIRMRGGRWRGWRMKR